jgi:hypothetical protein
MKNIAISGGCEIPAIVPDENLPAMNHPRHIR